jgi:hypothetical protein
MSPRPLTILLLERGWKNQDEVPQAEKELVAEGDGPILPVDLPVRGVSRIRYDGRTVFMREMR